jgi:DNA-binding transcriptional ArsR family regulator
MNYLSALTCLADPTRRAVFEALRAGPKSVGDIAAGLPVSRPAVSQHLKALKMAGLVSDTAQGASRFYSLERKGLEGLRMWVDSFWDEPLARFKAHVEKKSKGMKNAGRKD